MYKSFVITLLLALILSFPCHTLSRTAAHVTGSATPGTAAAAPAYCMAEHNAGRIVLSVTNIGTLGSGYNFTGGWDCFTGEAVHSCEFPRGSSTTYLFSGMLWIGAVVGEDTLVSTGADGWSTAGNEFHPDESPNGAMLYRSTLNSADPAFAGAVSEQDYLAVYSDTCTTCPGVTYDERDARPHRPLGIEVRQESYAWSYPHAEDFVLFDYKIKNLGPERLQGVYLGLYVDGDIHHLSVDAGAGSQDDISGFLVSAESPLVTSGCTDSVDLHLAWTADNNGDLGYGSISTPHTTGVLLLKSPSDSLKVSYNWWVSNGSPSLDFGPMTRDGYRDFGTGGLGTPSGDRNKYFVLSNGEFDYDQVRTGTIGDMDPVWLPPPTNYGQTWATGLDTRYLLSFGPFEIEPGEALPLTFAYVAGENFHTDRDNINNLPLDPDAYYENVDFSDLIANAFWATWTFDNPGVDTDGDGDSGKVTVCEGDSFWYEGDGVPDYRAAVGPDIPVFWVEPRPGALHVRWNGFASETCIDPFSQKQDFEGYNVYLSQGDEPVNFVRLAGYDVEDYYKYFWNPELSDWDVVPERFFADDLACTYAPAGCGDISWHPLDFPRENPYFMPGLPDSVFYFEPIMANACKFGHETPFVKIYPNAPRPSYFSPDQVPPDSAAVYLTDDGYFKYYEYEYLISGLTPDLTYWVAVTAFDHGSFVILASPLETAVEPNALQGVPFADETNCCLGSLGSIALVPDCGTPDQAVDITDIQLMIDHMFLTYAPLCCEKEGDVDLSGFVDIVDLQLLIDNQYINLNPLPDCP